MNTKTLLILSTILLASLAGCLASNKSAEPRTTGFTGIRFLAIGDQGTGGEAQYTVAEGMAKVCELRGCDFTLALGDNIYEIGTEDEYDPQFETKFEMPYANLSMPFYMTLGNHDNSADPFQPMLGVEAGGLGHWYESGNHEVAYHYRTDRTSDKWQMPARFYDFTEGNATFFSLDTNTLMFFGQAFAPTEITLQEQEAWIDEAIANADTPWKIAFGHHPYRSNGDHGDAGSYDGLYPTPLAGPYVEMFYVEHICNKVDIFITGHDHDLQWLEPTDACDQTELIVSGAAAKTRSAGDEERNPARFQRFDGYGFLWAEIDGDTFTGVFYDENGESLFEHSFTRNGAE